MFVVGAHVQGAWANVLCTGLPFYGAFVSSGTPVAPWQFRQTYDISQASVATFIDSVAPGVYYGRLHSLGAGASVPLGAACPGAAAGVYMSVGDYNVLAGSANVVTKLQELSELGVMALAVFGVLAGFVFGYKLVQRRDSQ